MRTIRLFILSVCSLFATGAIAQQSEGVKEEGAHQAEYNADGQVRDASAEVDSRENGEPAEVDAAAANAGEQTNLDAPAENVIITPTGTRTTSPSGSPGVLMDDPSVTDGTNTQQSASPNIAGSPVPGGSAGNGRDSNAEIPDNKKFSGKEQESVPMNKNNRTNQ
jgi:hypothetical protein